MKYIYFFIFLFSFSGYVYSKPIAGYNTSKLTPLPPLIDKNNPVVKFCETNGGTFIPESLINVYFQIILNFMLGLIGKMV